MKQVVIIGAGLGGLAAALRLRARGFAVTVFEAGSTFGGKMNQWVSRGFTFDTGPSLITMPWVFQDLYQAAGSRMEDHVELLPLHPLSEYVYDDGTRFTYTSSLPEWLRTVKQLEPRDVAGFLRFQQLGARLYEVSKRSFLRRAPTERPGIAELGALRHMPLRYGWGNYHSTVAAHFRSPYLRQLFDRYPTYVGSSPYRAPATLALIPYLEYAFGGYAVRGGLYTIAASLAQLCVQNGVTLCANSPVAKIETALGVATGVILANGERVPADVVVMNGDSLTLAEMLPGMPGQPPSTDARSMSGFVMLLGISRSLPTIAQHTIFFSADYQNEFADIFDRQQFPTDPTVYVNAASRADRRLVPGEGEALFVMANAPAMGAKWDAGQTAIAKERVLARLKRGGFPDVTSVTVTEDTWTPQRIEQRYLMPGGAIYGTDSHGWRNAFFRPRNQDAKVRNLYRVGGSTHPGGGTPTVLLSAEITCRLIS
jgi:phytoene desaturase